MEENFDMYAKTLYGFEDLLAKELSLLGAQNISKGNRGVAFRGDKGFMYKANLSLRTAIKILKPIHIASVSDPDALYQMCYDFPWEDYMEVTTTFAIDSIVFGDLFVHSQYVSQKAKDGLVDRFRDKVGERPNVKLNKPDLQINIHIEQDQCTLSLDSSGASLHQRGYRTATNIAPLNEVLAAGIILLSGWEGNTDFLDPMCGSGTLVIEAAMIAAKIPANINRKSFAFENWKDWDPDLFETIRSAQLEKVVNPAIKIMGYDKAPSAVEKSLQNVQNANLQAFVIISKNNFFHSEKTTQGPLHLLTNPPYGERLEGDINAIYQSMGDTLKQSYPNTHAWMITANMEAMKFVGLRPSRKIKIFNGKLESRLLYFPIYEGSKRTHKYIDSKEKEEE